MKSLGAGILLPGALGGVACRSNSTSPAEPSSRPSYSVSSLLSAGIGDGRVGFGFNGTLSGFPTGEVSLTGDGAFDPATASDVVPSATDVVSAGGFRCTAAVRHGVGCGEEMVSFNRAEEDVS